MTTFEKWVKNNLGKKIDYDGVYGVQCVDLVKHYIKNCLNTNPQNIGNAKEYWSKRNSSYIKSLFVAIKNTEGFIPVECDVFVRSSGECGHIGVVCSDKNTARIFYAYEQNAGGTHEGMTKHSHTNWATVNFLRPKYQKVYTNGSRLKGYTKMSDKACSVYIDNNTPVEVIEGNCGKKLVNNELYQMCHIKLGSKKYYVADIYLTIR